MIGKANFSGVTLAFLLAGVSLASASAKERVPIQREQIADALRFAGVPVSAEQVEELSVVFATKAAPALKVVSLAPLDGKLVKARLHCESSRICLPFYVVIHWPEASASDRAIADWRHASASGLRQLSKEETLVHSGKVATMIFEGQNVQMKLPVICLQNGGRGQQVRVTSTDRKRIFVARVDQQGIVRAEWGH